jgi:hypothetical protein
MAEQLTDVIGERTLEARMPDSDAVMEIRVRIGRPYAHPDPDWDWVCPIQILGLADEAVRNVYGIDAIQALTLALQMVGINLAAAARGGELRWLGRSDLGASPARAA